MPVSIVGNYLSSFESIRLSTNGMPSMSVQLRMEDTEPTFHVKDLYDALVNAKIALGDTRAPIVQLGTSKGQTVKAYMEILEIVKEPIVRNERTFWLVRIEYGFSGRWFYTPEIRRSIIQYEKKMDFAYEGGSGDEGGSEITWAQDAEDAQPTKRIENTARDPLDPPITGIITHTILDIHMSFASREVNTLSPTGDAGVSPGPDSGFDPSDVKRYINTINAVEDENEALTIAGIVMPAGTAKMLDIQPKPVPFTDSYGNKSIWWNVHYRIEYAPEGHYDLRENVGLNFLDPDDSYTKKEVRSEGGMADVQPVPLDTDGSMIDMTASNPETLKLAFRTLRCIRWKPLGLPSLAAEAFTESPIRFVGAE